MFAIQSAAQSASSSAVAFIANNILLFVVLGAIVFIALLIAPAFEANRKW